VPAVPDRCADSGGRDGTLLNTAPGRVPDENAAQPPFPHLKIWVFTARIKFLKIEVAKFVDKCQIFQIKCVED